MHRLAFLLALIGAPLVAEPRFVDRAPVLGIDHTYTGGWEHFVGGGIAAFDCNDDSLPELFAAGGAAPAVLLRNVSIPGDDLAYRIDTPASLALKGVTGAYPLNINGDGFMDLVILRVGANLILAGGPDCSFAPLPGSDLMAGTAWTTAFAATWEGEAQRPTLAFGNYVDRNDPKGPFGACADNDLFRPEGAGYVHVVLAPSFCTLSLLFTDWARRGHADLRVSNDRHYYLRGGSEQLWSMAAAPRLYTEAEGWQPYALWGMGIASRDITGDGQAEVYLTSMADQRLQFRTHGDTPHYTDAPFEYGTAAQRPFIGDEGRPSTGWHAAFGDVDNDGRDDLFVAKGNVEAMPSNAMEDPNNLLMQGADGRFAEMGDKAGIASVARSRGAVLADLNGDGWLDLAVMNRNAPMEIYQNITQDDGHWLLLDIRQSAPNRNAVGAFIEVRTPAGTQTREITIGGGHASGANGAHHFGLGAAQQAELRVIWPDQTASDWIKVKANQRKLIAR